MQYPVQIRYRSTDYTIGDTAMNTVQDAIDKIRDTAYPMKDVSVLKLEDMRVILQ